MLNLGAKFKPTQPFMVPNFMVCKLQVCVEGVLNVLFTYTTQVPAQPSLAACTDGDCLGGETCSCAQSCYLEGNCCSDIVTSAGCLPSKCVIIVLVVTVWVERLVPVLRAVILRATVVVILSLLLAAYLASVYYMFYAESSRKPISNPPMDLG